MVSKKFLMSEKILNTKGERQMKMTAIIKPAREKGLAMVRKEVPQIGFGEALVKIHYTAICGTDVHI